MVKKSFENKIAIGLCGLPGAGKTEFVRVAKREGFFVYRMGTVVWSWVKKKKLKLTNENVAKVANEEREKFGRQIWAERTVKIIDKKTKNIIIDGIRSMEEVKVFKEYFTNFILVAVHANQKIRFRRVLARSRIDDINSQQAFLERELREKAWGIEEVIKQADFLIINEDSIEEFKANIKYLLASLVKFFEL